MGQVFMFFVFFPLEYYNGPVDETISPKKCKNIPHLDLRSSLPSSEWTLVRFTPEEEKPLAVQVLVTSDGSRYWLLIQIYYLE